MVKGALPLQQEPTHRLGTVFPERLEMHPMTRVKVTTHAKNNSRVRIYNHGEDDRVINEGDLLIVSEGSDVDFEITIRGRDILIFEQHVAKAVKLWNENKDYLMQPATREVETPKESHKSYTPVSPRRSDDLIETYRRWVSTQRDSA